MELKERLTRGLAFYSRIDSLRKELSPSIRDLLFLPLSAKTSEPGSHLVGLLRELRACVEFFHGNREYKGAQPLLLQYEMLEERVLHRIRDYFSSTFKDHARKLDYHLLVKEQSFASEPPGAYALLDSLYSRVDRGEI